MKRSAAVSTHLVAEDIYVSSKARQSKCMPHLRPETKSQSQRYRHSII